MLTQTVQWTELAREIGPGFAARAAEHDENDAFVADNYAVLREHKVFSALVPVEFGGGGASHREVCALLRELAHFCPSTALALSMHQHLVAAAVFNHRHGRPGQKLLEAVGGRELVLVSTGANDWLASSGEAVKVEGGYRVNAAKPFASGSPAGDMLVTSAPYKTRRKGGRCCTSRCRSRRRASPSTRTGWRWACGARDPGRWCFKDVFVAEGAVSLRRPRAKYHAVYNIDHGLRPAADHVGVCRRGRDRRRAGAGGGAEARRHAAAAG